MTTRTGRYAALLDEDAHAATNYSHGDRIFDPKVRVFLARMSEDTRFNRMGLAKELQVTRQTVHSWIRKVRENQPISPRGRRPLYDGAPCITVRIAVPLPVAAMLIARHTRADEPRSTSLHAAIRREMEKRVAALEAAKAE
jgi:transposase-like protein